MATASTEASTKKPTPKRAPKAQEQAPVQAAPEAAEPEYKAPTTYKEVGSANFEIKEVPSEIKNASIQRFGKPGVEMNVTAARANGSYRGEVMATDKYLAQKVGDKSIVIHQKNDIELVSQKHQWMAKENKLGGSDLQIHYDGEKAKAYPHDKQREEVSRLVESMKKIAEKIQLPNVKEFKDGLDQVKEGLLAQLKEKRVDQTKDKQPKQQEQQRNEHSR
jgi:putative DNA primase/helicase